MGDERERQRRVGVGVDSGEEVIRLAKTDERGRVRIAKQEKNNGNEEIDSKRGGLVLKTEGKGEKKKGKEEIYDREKE